MAAEDGDARLHGAEQVEADRQTGADHDAVVQMRGEGQRGEEGHHGGDAVVAAGLPGVLDRAEIHQSRSPP
jgi:DnaJ-class molecular chaperone